MNIIEACGKAVALFMFYAVVVGLIVRGIWCLT